jgi:hypothetical protein
VVWYYHQLKIGDLFVQNSYKDKLYIKMLKFLLKLIDTITTTNFYLKFKENDENDMAAQSFLGCFLFHPTAEPNAQPLILTVLPFHPLYFSCFVGSTNQAC